ncbi:MAG: AMP-binding protein [Deferribacterota bacterium]|nr:AMP-binding protein [Deferribacterota bacterium]
MWERFGEREAFVCIRSDGEKRYTFKEYKDRTLRLANGLQRMGLKPGDKVAIMLYNGNEYMESMFGSWFIGCVTPLVNWHFRGEELVKMLNIRKPNILILEDEFAERINEVKDRLEGIEQYIVVGGKREGMLSYEELIKESPASEPKIDFTIGINPYTGGTTGVPKSVGTFGGFGYIISDKFQKPHGASWVESLIFAVKLLATHYYWGCAGFKMKGMTPGPLYHGTPIYFTLTTFLLGGSYVFRWKYEPEECLRIIEKEKINYIHCAPVHVQRIIMLPNDIKRKYDLSSMRTIVTAAAPCPLAIKKAINDLFMQQGCASPVYSEYYSSVEMMMPITILRQKDYIEKPKRLDSVGKNHRGGDVKIFDETYKECPPNKEGIVHTRSLGTVSLNYPGMEDLLKENIHIIDGVEWYNDFLYGCLDEDDFLYLTGREKEMIIVGGVNVFPNEIEAAIIKHPKVYEAVVIRYPDKDLGEVPMAVIQLKEGERMNKDEIIEHCKKEGLYGFKIPKVVEFVKEIPKTAHGKTLKRELEKKYWEDRGIKRRG